jgi:alpha-galactosidase/6-phospho-beta-glucosidase family protein
MRYEGDRAVDLKICYIGGGSRGWAWKLMSDLFLDGSLSGELRLHDIDREAAATNVLIGNRLFGRDARPRWACRAVDDLGEALEGADFVVASILPGSFEDMGSDVHAPERLGVWQSVGDSVGPGGMVRALRTIPTYRGFASEIRRRCPEAWVVNYTNPLSLCLRALYEEFPGIKAFGCCHEVFGTQEFLAEVAAERLGIPLPRRREIAVNVLGINHFTWLDAASWKGVDLFPHYRAFADEHGAEGWEGKGPETWKTSYFESGERVKMDLFLTYGLAAAAGDRHLAEFLPRRYLRDPQTAREWMFSLTPVSYRIEKRKGLLALAKSYAAGEEGLVPEETGEEGVRQMAAILGLGDIVTNVNLPNRGQIPDLPADAIVETNAAFSRGAVRPLHAGALPPQVAGLVSRHLWNQEALHEGAFAEDPEACFCAFRNDPMLDEVSTPDARALFRDMIRATLPCLPDYWARWAG